MSHCFTPCDQWVAFPLLKCKNNNKKMISNLFHSCT